ncbi:MAG: YqgE/AlgH family protein [Pirellulales bacterium]|nr:YqgE/AlgH family protein [Pirellulales bacterium]
MNSLKGHVLVASPYLLDPNFVRTVVLLLHHSDEGAFGVVLNRPAEDTIKDLWQKVTNGTCDNEQLVHVGGPVSGPLMALHTVKAAAEMEVLPGLYFAAQRENLEKILRQKKHPVRVFVGHAGWGGGQLEKELKEGAWLTGPAESDYVFYDWDIDLWKRVSKQIGNALLTGMLRIKHIPDDPSCN